MVDAFSECLLQTLREESGEVQAGRPYVRGKWSFMDHPADPGGATMMGITHRVYDAWRTIRGLPSRDVREIEDGEIDAIYYENYWQPIRGDELPNGVDLALFDFAVNSGPGTAVKKLQACLGVTIDGQLGVATMLAIHSANPQNLVERLMAARRAYCRNLKNYAPFAKGWAARWGRIEASALARVVDPESVPVHDWQTDIMPQRDRAVERPLDSMAKSDTANVSVGVGATGMAGVGVSASNAAEAASAHGDFSWATFLLKLSGSVPFWLAVGTIAGALIIYLERLRKHRLETAT